MGRPVSTLSVQGIHPGGYLCSPAPGNSRRESTQRTALHTRFTCLRGLWLMAAAVAGPGWPHESEEAARIQVVRHTVVLARYSVQGLSPYPYPHPYPYPYPYPYPLRKYHPCQDHSTELEFGRNCFHDFWNHVLRPRLYNTTGYGRRSACFCAPCICAKSLMLLVVKQPITVFSVLLFRGWTVDMEAVCDRWIPFSSSRYFGTYPCGHRN